MASTGQDISYVSDDWEFYSPTPVPVDSCPPLFYPEEPKQPPRGASVLSVCVLILLVVCLLAFVGAIGGIIGRFFLGKSADNASVTQAPTVGTVKTECPCTQNTLPPAGAGRQTGGSPKMSGTAQSGDVHRQHGNSNPHPSVRVGGVGHLGSGSQAHGQGGDSYGPVPTPDASDRLPQVKRPFTSETHRQVGDLPYIPVTMPPPPPTKLSPRHRISTNRVVKISSDSQQHQQTKTGQPALNGHNAQAQTSQEAKEYERYNGRKDNGRRKPPAPTQPPTKHPPELQPPVYEHPIVKVGLKPQNRQPNLRERQKTTTEFTTTSAPVSTTTTTTPSWIHTEPRSTVISIPTTPHFTPSTTPMHGEMGGVPEDVSDVRASAGGKSAVLYRVPLDKLTPVHYDVTLQLMPDDRMEGIASITIRVGDKPTRVIGLHAKEMNIQKVHVTEILSKFDMFGSAGTWELDPGRETLTIRPRIALQARGMYNVSIRYDAPVCENKGINCDEGTLYRSFATKFEPTFARYVFPGIDDPAAKATFSTRVIYKKSTNMTVLANEDVCKREQRGDWVIETFCKTPKMSSYNFALVAGNLKSSCNFTSSGLRICIWMNPRWAKSLDYALVTALDAFNRAQHYFQIPYKMSKLDIVGIYGYPTAAMENWGLIVHHVSSLAVELSTPEMIQDIITHEIAHQWFGNLVTMTWWDDIWINEGFAEFFTFHFRQHDRALETKLKYYVYLMLTMSVQAVPEETTALVRNHTTPGALAKSFQNLGFLNLYIKGAYTVGMIKDLLEPNAFRAGCIDFLRRYSFKTADRFELLRSMQGRVGVDKSLEEIMIPWLENSGYPEVHLLRNATSGKMILKQYAADEGRHIDFYEITRTKRDTKIQTLWPIPVTYKSRSSRRTAKPAMYWLHEPQQHFAIEGLRSDDWVLLNPGFQFMYSVNYDPFSLRLISEQLASNPRAIPEESRAQLISDAAYFYRYNEHRLLEFIELLGYLQREVDALPWVVGMDKMMNLFMVFKETNLFSLLQIHFGPSIFQVFELSQRLAGNSPERKLFEVRQGQICRLICVIGHEHCLRQAQRDNATILHGEEIGADHKMTEAGESACPFIFLTKRVLHYTEDEEFERLLELMRTPGYFDLSSVPTMYYISLLCAPNRFFVHELLEILIEQQELSNVVYHLMFRTSLTLEPCPYMYHELWQAIDRVNDPNLFADLKMPKFRYAQGLSFSITRPDEVAIARRLLPEAMTHAIDKAEKRIEWVRSAASKISNELYKRIHTPQWVDSKR